MIPFEPIDRNIISPYFICQYEEYNDILEEYEGYFFTLSTVLDILELNIYDDDGKCLAEFSFNYEIVDDKTGVIWDFSNNIIRRLE